MEGFKAIVRKIDRVSKEGDHRQTVAMLAELLAVEPEDPLYSKKKSHFIAALAFRAHGAEDDATALALLDLADREIPDGHLIPMLRRERGQVRAMATRAPSPT